MSRISRLAAGLALVFALVLAACGNGGDAVAIVNDEEIERAELDALVDQQEQQYQMQGMELDDDMRAEVESQMLDMMIQEQLLVQHARSEGYEPSSAEVDAEYDATVESIGGQEALDGILEDLDMTTDDVRDDIASQMAIQAMLEDAVGTEEPTETELRELYDGFAGGQGEDFPPFEDLEEQLRMQWEQSQQGEVIEQLLADLEAESEIEILL